MPTIRFPRRPDDTALDSAGDDGAAPEMEKTSSTGIKKAPSMARSGCGK